MTRHPVPDAALEADIATIAQKGAGKTFANRGLVERLLDQRRRVVVLDPLNSWWGLKAKADGCAGYAIAVVGGPNADVPLDPHQGEALATYIAGADVSVVIDVSELKRGEMIRFANDFLSALYRLNRDPLWLVLEEADVFAPQQPMGDATMLLHNVDQIARRGRARGFRLWTITQRPAKLHKDVLTQTSTLIMLRIRSPQDRAAAEEWIKGNADAPQAREIVSSLASLPVGEGWIWAPDQDLLERVKFPPIKTLDTSATPEAGAQRPQIGKLAAIDLDALRQALTIVAAAPQGLVQGGIDVGLQLKQAEERGYQRGFSEGQKLASMLEWRRGIESAQRRIDTALEELRLDSEKFIVPIAAAPAPAKPARAKPAPVATAAKPKTTEPGALSGAARNLETALSSNHTERMRWQDACVIAMLSPDAGWTRKAINELRAADMVEEADGFVTLKYRPGMRHPFAAIEIVEGWAGKLGGAAAKILRHLYSKQPQTLEEVSFGIDLAVNAGWTRKGWKAVRRNNLVEQLTDGRWVLSQVLQSLRGKNGH